MEIEELIKLVKSIRTLHSLDAVSRIENMLYILNHMPNNNPHLAQKHNVHDEIYIMSKIIKNTT